MNTMEASAKVMRRLPQPADPTLYGGEALLRVANFVGCKNPDGIPLWLHMSKVTWLTLVSEGRAPAPLKLGKRHVVWKKSDILAWMADPTGWTPEKQKQSQEAA